MKKLPPDFTGTLQKGFWIYWYVDGKLHRIGSPACKNRATDIWYFRGKRHNLEGPTFVLSGGNNLWFILDTYVNHNSHIILAFSA